MLKRKVRDFRFGYKADEAGGKFEGHASVFDVIDSYREVVMPGAFQDTISEWKSSGRFPPCLWQHFWYEPIGPITHLEEDSVGLLVRGDLLIDDVPRAREARALMKAKAITGMSFGFDVDEEEYDSRAAILRLKKIDLWEVSVVTFPANEAAQIESVKSAFGGKLPSVRDFEDFLREAGFSKSHAAAIATYGLGRLRREAESSDAKANEPGAQVERLAALICNAES